MKKVVIVLFSLMGSLPAYSNSGLYGEVSLGTVESEASFDGSTSFGGFTENFSETQSFDRSIGFGVGGGYLFNPNIALEVAYRDYGEAEDQYIDEFSDTINDKVSSSALKIGLKGIYPLNNIVSLNGKIGLASWDLDTETTDSAFPGQTFESSASGTDIYWAIGAAYLVNHRLSLGIEYSTLTMSFDTSSSVLIEDSALDVNLDTDFEVGGIYFTGSYTF